MTATSGLRADAARNRRLLLDAAAAEFAEHGADVSISRIAARAGIGKGTVFRHFATKERLLAAVFNDRIEDLIATGRRLLEAADPRAALLEFMVAGAGLRIGDRSLCQSAASIARTEADVRDATLRLAEVAEALTARARETRAVRADVTGHDIVLLVGAVSQATAPLGDAVPGLWRRYLHLMFAGLDPSVETPLPVPPPVPADFAP
ncbi:MULTISPECIES: TetR/AcrR family transcriptional regulator [Actinomadura]|uniref:TetR/AcrR family transcriptional regulator n=1 Tax=Actinomadura yumaensis TaxID=111807 RepID=A0ABW2CZP9_9ACTN|nr:TetR/AcrR family transcriptional regulator [Actinomadura sp. J1-007]MWK38870.1 TetR family transcriptional regulator [Actinomadura sp. J1-007]